MRITASYLYVYSISIVTAMQAACQINSEYLISPVITVTRGVGTIIIELTVDYLNSKLLRHEHR